MININKNLTRDQILNERVCIEAYKGEKGESIWPVLVWLNMPEIIEYIIQEVIRFLDLLIVKKKLIWSRIFILKTILKEY